MPVPDRRPIGTSGSDLADPSLVPEDHSMEETELVTPVGCTIRRLPDHLIIPAARNAVLEDPRNEPPLAQFATLVNHPSQDAVMRPEFIAALTTKFWGPQSRRIPVYFVDNPNQATRRMILEYANIWDCSVSFRETMDRSSSLCRIGRGPEGHFSYLGTDNGMIPVGEITMNLQGFTENTPISEYLRVVPHEFGHYLGCPHEHSRAAIVARLNREAVIREMMRSQGWSRAQVIAQVFTPLEESSLMIPGVAIPPAEEDSAMSYRFEAYLTLDGRPIVGGTRPTPNDLVYIRKIYPKVGTVDPSQPPGAAVSAEINRVRAGLGLPALVEVAKLRDLAQVWAMEMAGRDQLDHGDSGTRIASVFPGIANGEIIAEGQRDASQAVADWLTSAGHKRIMLGPYAGIGAGSADSSNGTRYWVADFIGKWDDPTPNDPPPPVEPPAPPSPVDPPKGTRLRQGRWSAASKYDPTSGPTPFLMSVAKPGPYAIDVAGDGKWEVQLTRVGEAQAVPMRAIGKPEAPQALVGLQQPGDYLLTVRHRNAKRPGAFRVRYM